MINFFEALLGYHLQMSYKDNCALQLKFEMVDENAAILRNLKKELKVNLAESQKLQTFYHNKYIKEFIY